MDIPLIELHNFIDYKNGTINFREQVSYGIEIAKQKQQQLCEKIQKSELLRQKMDSSDKVLFSKNTVSCLIEEKKCAVVPMTGSPTAPQYYMILIRLLNELKKFGIQNGCESGMICQRLSNPQYFVFMEINTPITDISSHIKTLTIPAQTFYCTRIKSKDFCENTRFEMLIPPGSKSKTIILAEMFGSDFDYRQPDFELRWHE